MVVVCFSLSQFYYSNKLWSSLTGPPSVKVMVADSGGTSWPIGNDCDVHRFVARNHQPPNHENTQMNKKFRDTIIRVCHFYIFFIFLLLTLALFQHIRKLLCSFPLAKIKIQISIKNYSRKGNNRLPCLDNLFKLKKPIMT